MKRGRGGSYYNRLGGQFQKQTTTPAFTVPPSAPSTSGSDDNNRQNNVSLTTFSTDREPGSYVGWKLYFPGKAYKDSHDLIRRTKAMEQHINQFIHWYDLADIEEKCQFPLILKNLEDDTELFQKWPTFNEDLVLKSTETLACLGLAMHNVIVEKMNEGNDDYVQHQKKIFTRPIGFESGTKLSDACQTSGKLITVTGTVVSVDPIKTNCKMVCYKCSSCLTELVVQQNPKSLQYVYPSSCHRGCPARGGFAQRLTSAYTVYQPKQMIKLKELKCKEMFNLLHVELVQNHIDTIIPGLTVKVTGVVKHCQDKSKKFLKKGEAMSFQSYLKCFNVEIISKFESRQQEPTLGRDFTVINMIRAEPSPFRLLVHSLCPSIYGREEVKAGLILSLLSGNDLMKKRRSESHVLMIGNPGAGKSKLLQACAEVSTKGIYVSGPTSTAVGLTATVGQNGSAKAGALMLADRGVCCIDEFDKMLGHMHILLESMEQQVISIMKCGLKINASSEVVLITAANPIGSFYDRSKTAIENVKISVPLMTRFDLIFALTEQAQKSDDAFVHHVSNNRQNASTSFFNSSARTPQASRCQNRDKISWLHLSQGERLDPLPVALLQLYLEHARETVHPVLSQEAKVELFSFYTSLRALTVGNEVLPITLRQFEGLVRLTLSRARADMAGEATRQHAIDAINVVKFSMIDIFAPDDPTDPTCQLPVTAKKTPTLNVSKTSIPKQVKAFAQHLETQVELLQRDYFTRAELRTMTKEIGVKDFEEVIHRLNEQGMLLMKPGGYKFCP